MFADSDVAERHWKERVLGGRESVDTQRVLKARNQHGTRPQSASTRSSLSGARIFPCSRATCSICSNMVNFIDIAAHTVCSLGTRYLHATLTIKFTQSS
jgi:hypothetical protein